MDREVGAVGEAMLSRTDAGGLRLGISMPPSSELRSASPLKGEAVTCAILTHSTASHLRGEAARRADEGDIDNKELNFILVSKLLIAIIKL